MFDQVPKTNSAHSDPVLLYERVKFLCSNSVYQAERTPSLALTHGSATRLKQRIKQMALTINQVLALTPSELQKRFKDDLNSRISQRSLYLQPDLGAMYTVYLKSREHSSYSTSAVKLELNLKIIYEDQYDTEENRSKAQSENKRLYSLNHFRRLWADYCKTKITPTFRKPTYPGHQSEFDFCGVTLPCTDGTKAQFAVLVLNHSRMCYVEAIKDQSTDSSIQAIVNGFKFFGGVTDNLSIDNFKAAVKKAGTYGGELTDAFKMLQQFLGTFIMTMKVRRGNLKGVAESHVKIVTHTLLARMKQRITEGQPFASIKEMNDWLLKNLYRINQHKISGLQLTREELFTQERKALRPLNNWHFCISKLFSFTLSNTARVLLNSHQYCLPYELVGHKLQMEQKPEQIVFYEGGRYICAYKRQDGIKGISAQKGYVPNKQMFAEVLLAIPDAMWFEWAGAIGANTQERVRKLLSGNRNIDRARRALKLLQLCNGYTAWYKPFDDFLGSKRNDESISKISSDWKTVDKPDTNEKDSVYNFDSLYTLVEQHLEGNDEPLHWGKQCPQQTRPKGRAFMHFKSGSNHTTDMIVANNTDMIADKDIEQITSQNIVPSAIDASSEKESIKKLSSSKE